MIDVNSLKEDFVEDSSNSEIQDIDNNVQNSTRPIVGIGFVSSIKSLLMDGSSDEDVSLEKIAKKCTDDFVLKCVKILEDCTEMPSTAYTYVIFMERFGWIQQEDATTKPGTKNIVALGRDKYIATKILDLYNFKYRMYIDNHVVMEYLHKNLLDNDKREKSITEISNMFGKGLFPEINIWYNFNDDENKWQYVYSITAPEGSLIQKQ